MKTQNTLHHGFIASHRALAAWVAALSCLLPPLGRAQTAVEFWVQPYNGPGNGQDYAKAVTVDGSNNVIVTGSAVRSANNLDYVTIKYSSLGVPLWTNSYNGPGNSDDDARAVAVDASGCVYVTGTSTGSGTGYDWATIKYSSAGVPLWTNRYNALSSQSDGGIAMAVDGRNDLIVTGYGYPQGYLSYVTIKYSGAGVPLWTNFYRGPWNNNFPAAVAVDGSSDVIVTGASYESGGTQDYVTIKYSSAGAAVWTNRYNGPGNGPDSAVALAVDSGSNIIVAGYSFGTTYDYATIKYSSSGTPLWTNRYDGPANNAEFLTAVAADSNNNVIVTGYSYAGSDHFDYATLKYSGAGVPLWTNRYNGSGSYEDRAVAVAVGDNGNVFVTGYSACTNDVPLRYDYATIEYSGVGVPLWTNRYNGSWNGDDRAAAIALDSSGHVIVTGYSQVSEANNDYVTIKYWVPQPIRLAIEPDGADGYFLRFNGVPGHGYRLQRATSPAGPWMSSDSQTAPLSGLVEFWDLFPPPDKAFYRARGE